MSRTERSADRRAATRTGSGALAIGLAGIALSRSLLLLRPART